MKRVNRKLKASKVSKERLSSIESSVSDTEDLNSRVELIQSLIPIALKAVSAELQSEVERLVGGAKHERTGSDNYRWGSNPGSVVLGGQKVKINVPRVRNSSSKKGVPLDSYERFQGSGSFNEHIFRQLMSGVSSGKYEEASEHVSETFGISSSSVSRRFKQESSKRLRELFERDLSEDDLVAVFIDGKSFGDMQLVIALGITLEGEKRVLGFVETGTENGEVCRDFLQGLVNRGLKFEEGLLCIVDGAKGLYKGIKRVFGRKALVQRCQWHKRENVLSYLSKTQQELFRPKLQAAYEQPTYEKAKARLKSIRSELELVNLSAVASLDEGLEETLTLHKLGVFEQLGKSFKTTNCIENLNRQIQQYTGRVCKWKNSSQRQRWVASALMLIEPKLNKVAGHKHIQLLRDKIKLSLKSNLEIAA